MGLIIGSLFIWIPLQFFILPNLKAMESGEKTIGTVVDVKTSHSSKGGTSYMPTIAYTTKTGEKFSYTPSYSSGLFPHSKGQKVDIIYNRNTPGDAIIDDLVTMWLIPGVFSLFGLIPVTFSIIEIRRKRAEKNSEMTGIYDPSKNYPQPPGPKPPPII